MPADFQTILLACARQEDLASLGLALEDTEARIVAVTHAEHARNCLRQEEVAAAIIDVELADGGGFDLLDHIVKQHSRVPAVVTSRDPRVDVAVRALRQGAFDFLQLPVNPERIRATLAKALGQRTLLLQNELLRSEIDARYGIQSLVGNSAPMQALYRQMYQVAPARTNLLLTGESGTGKELVAHAVHLLSPRREKTFVRVNCGALPESLIESELFGHEKGAFTSASARRPGRFELADGGTLFLDEIGEVTPPVQVKLLRAIEEREFERVGGTRTLRVDVRLIAATNVNLEEAVAAGTFREDLYYRLKVLTLALPPLRERREDIPLLLAHFGRQFAAEHSKQPLRFTPEVRQALFAYNWPGNVRELRNLVEGLCVLNTGEVVEVGALPAPIRKARVEEAFLEIKSGMTLAEAERRLILSTLEATSDNREEAARRLGIGLRTLYRKLAEYKKEE